MSETIPPRMTDENHYAMPDHGWTCFHCGETFLTPGVARAHFGFDITCEPACRIKLGAERGLLGALRRVEAENQQLHTSLLAEDTAWARRYHAQQARHDDQLRRAEELGYERGLADGRKERAGD